MGQPLRILDQLNVASPCPASWDQMTGDDRSRFCHGCQKHVYDFSEMTEAEILELLASKGDGVCGRLYKREDGRLLTSDCAVGIRRIQRHRQRVAAAVAAMLSLVVTGVTFGAIRPKVPCGASGLQEVGPMRFLARWMGDRSHTRMVMGFVVGPGTSKYGQGAFGPRPHTPDPVCEPTSK